MFHAIRKQINPATVMAFIALVFATTGGAFAISGHNGGNGGANATAAKSKAKPKGKPGPRGPAGPKGETGAAGPAGSTGPAGSKGENGAAGTKGENGAAGTNGTNGKDGESVSIAKLEPGQGGCLEGGTKFAAGGKEATACNGEKGEKGESGGAGSFPTTLPEGATETGVGLVTFTSGTEDTYVPISFPIPLPLSVENLNYVSTEAQEKHTGPSQCPGNAEKPKAEKGSLCVYEAATENLVGKFEVLSMLGMSPSEYRLEATNVAGVLLSVSLGEGPSRGEKVPFVWAVSAP